MPDQPLINVPYIRQRGHEPGVEQLIARVAYTDGHARHPGGTFIRSMIELIEDRPDSNMTQHCHLTAAPIREDLWLKHGDIVDTDGNYYEPATGRPDARWTA